MAILTSQNDLTNLRRSGKILASALQAARDLVKPGVTTQALNDCAEEVIRQAGGIPAFLGYEGYPGSLCTSLNDEVVHGIPSAKVKLQAGDIIGLDLGVAYEGIFTDAAITVAVDPIDDQVKHLLHDTVQALTLALMAVKPGQHIGDIGAAVQDHLEPKGYGIVYQLVGHGVGRSVHEPPSIPNVGKRGTGPVIEEGMVLAIEPMITLGGSDVITKKDGWTVATADHSLAAHFEHTVLVTARGCEIITK